MAASWVAEKEARTVSYRSSSNTVEIEIETEGIFLKEILYLDEDRNVEAEHEKEKRETERGCDETVMSRESERRRIVEGQLLGAALAGTLSGLARAVLIITSARTGGLFITDWLGRSLRAGIADTVSWSATAFGGIATTGTSGVVVTGILDVGLGARLANAVTWSATALRGIATTFAGRLVVTDILDI